MGYPSGFDFNIMTENELFKSLSISLVQLSKKLHPGTILDHCENLGILAGVRFLHAVPCSKATFSDISNICCRLEMTEALIAWHRFFHIIPKYNFNFNDFYMEKKRTSSGIDLRNPAVPLTISDKFVS